MEFFCGWIQAMPVNTSLFQEYLRQVLHYDLHSGYFHWIQQKKGRKNAALPAGCVSGVSGYRAICIDYKSYYAHRLAWLYVTGKWPIDQIDHIDGNRDNNSFSNLREANSRQNNVSRASRGFHLDDRGKYHVTVSNKGKSKYVGRFSSPEDAKVAYIKAATEIHGTEWIARSTLVL